jgi:hypothetical protein
MESAVKAELVDLQLLAAEHLQSLMVAGMAQLVLAEEADEAAKGNGSLTRPRLVFGWRLNQEELGHILQQILVLWSPPQD